MYIGASVRELTKSIPRTAAFIGDNYRIRGNGAQAMTPQLAHRLIRRWWASASGTRLAVGWLHSDAFLKVYVNHVNPTPDLIRLVSVQRPRRRDLNEALYMNVEELFEALLLREVRKKDPRVRHFDHRRDWRPMVSIGGSPRTFRGLGPLVVWPNGVVDAATNEAISRIGTVVDQFADARWQRRTAAAAGAAGAAVAAGGGLARGNVRAPYARHVIEKAVVRAVTRRRWAAGVIRRALWKRVQKRTQLETLDALYRPGGRGAVAAAKRFRSRGQVI